MDPSRRLALQLMRQDLEELRAAQKGEDREDELDDLTMALQLEELQICNHIQMLDDEEYCRHAYPEPDAEQDAAPATDEAIPSTVDADPAATTPTSNPLSVVAEMTAEHLEIAEAHESSSVHEPDPTDDTQSLACAACGKVQDERLAVRAPCGHVYCPDCLTLLFGAATTDESLFPPRCCKTPIPLDAAEKWLPAELIAQLEKKQIEFTTPNRTYCYNVQCSAFIPPLEITSTVGYCQACKESTCTVCKSAAHDGLCPDDPSTQEILAVAKQNSWQQCFGCKNIVELDTGCNHMSK